MRAIDVLERMGRLRDKVSTPLYQRYTENVQRDILRKENGPVLLGHATASGATVPSGLAFAQRETSRLNLSDAYFVTRDMQALVEGASLTLDDTDQFAQDLWPTEYGFLLLEDGHQITDVRGETLVTHAITWGRSIAHDPSGRTQPGVMVVMYTDPRDMRDTVNVSLIQSDMGPDRMQLGDLVMTHMMWYVDGQRVGPPQGLPAQDEAEFIERFGPDVNGKMPILKPIVNDSRFFLSLLLMLNQSITTLDRQHVEGRHDLKRLRRMKLPGSVTVIKLRRHTTRSQDGEPVVEWHHSWIVRGHWRWQPYGQRNADHEHDLEKPVVVQGKRSRRCTKHGCDYREDRIYINPFIKGPEDKPLKQTDKVYALVR